MPKAEAPSYPGIAEQLWPLVLPVEALRLHPRNPRHGDVGAISESLRVFGQQKPVVAQRREDGPHILVAGNHLYLGALELRWTHIAVVVTDLDDKTATRYMLADNRTSQLGTFESSILSTILSELAVDDLLEATGYDGDDVDRLLSKVAAPQHFEGVASTGEYRCPSCSYEWNGPPK